VQLSPGADFHTSVDIVVSWMGAAALLRYGSTLNRRRDLSILEARTRPLILVLIVVLLLRGFSFLLPSSALLSVMTATPASFLPLTATLFIEGLLRRHVPRWLKLLAITSTFLSLVAGIAGGATPDPGITSLFAKAFLVPLLATLLALGVVLITRDRSTLSSTENALVTACVVVTLVAVPLAATDFRTGLGWPPVRMGTLGILIFCYTLLRTPQENARFGRWVNDVVLLAGKSAVASLTLAAVLPGSAPELLFPIFVLGLALIFTYAIWDRLRDVDVATGFTELLRWLGNELPESLNQFARELRHLALTSDARILDETDLSAYDADSLREALKEGDNVGSLGRLRAIREDLDNRSILRARGADELTDLLDRRGMTHVGLLSSNPLRLLVATLPELPGVRDTELALVAVVRRGQHAVTREHSLTGTGARTNGE
jgi:hypothetical protein